MNILAIDPGKKGGFFVKSPGGMDLLCSLPLTEEGLPDVYAMQNWIIGYNIKVVILERQQIRSAQAGQAVIMEAYGMLKATAVLCDAQLVEYRPKQWQKIIGVSGDKQEHIDYAETAGFDIPWTSYKKNGEPTARAKKHDGIADAVCIGLAYREMMKHD